MIAMILTAVRRVVFSSDIYLLSGQTDDKLRKVFSIPVKKYLRQTHVDL